MDSTNYRDMIAAGKGKLEWERKIPEEKINDLKEMLNVDDFNDNLPAVIIKYPTRKYFVDTLCPPGYQQDQPALLQDVQRSPPR